MNTAVSQADIDTVDLVGIPHHHHHGNGEI